MKLFDSELKVMDVLWTNGDMPARQIAAILTESIGWNVNTTYTLIKRCIAKNAIERIEPGFLCHALVSKQQMQEEETQELNDKVFDGSADKLFAALVGGKRVSAEQLQKLRTLIDDMGNRKQGNHDDLSFLQPRRRRAHSSDGAGAAFCRQP